MRETKSRGLGNVRCITSEDQRVVVKDDEVKEMWSYFHKWFNENHTRQPNIETNSPFSCKNNWYIRKIKLSKFRGALKKMKTRRVVGPDISFEVWKCLGDT